MSCPRITFLGVLCLLFVSPLADGQWVTFIDETADRLDGDADLTTTDDQEKDYAWADVDKDGDIDLVCVRKQPFTSAGQRANVLFMNEGTAEGHSVDGVLVDRTADYAAASDVTDDEGFLTATNDRDVLLVDVDGDTWLDIVTVVTNAATFTDEDKHISHPRIYMNLGEDLDGDWLGFEYQDERIPEILVDGVPEMPCFCSVTAGDVDGDDDLDLYFGDYDSSCDHLSDVNDRLLLNDGDGYFEDVTDDNFVGDIRVIGVDYPFFQSAFGTSVSFADFNDDGYLDLVKDTALVPPQYVGIAYGNPTVEGTFDEDEIGFQVVDTMAPYFVEVGDLNDDGLLDLVVVDDEDDHYWLNDGNDDDDRVNWDFKEFSFTEGIDDGFGGNAVIRDLDNDGMNDVIVADVDIDIPGCSRRMHIYRNLGDTPSVTLEEQGGSQDWTPNGVHDVAVFDLNDDGWLDMVIGTCDGTEVWINQPPDGLAFDYPEGRPSMVAPGVDSLVTFSVRGVGEATPATATGKLYYSVDGGPFDEADVEEVEDNLYEATIPGADCTERVEYYVTAESEDEDVYADPRGYTPLPDGELPEQFYLYRVAAELTETVNYDFNTEEPDGWETTEGAGEIYAWEWTDTPNGSEFAGTIVAPDNDAEAVVGGGMWVTGLGEEGDSAGVHDVDGPTTLTSEEFDLDGTDAEIRFSWWYVELFGGINELSVEVSNGGTYEEVFSTTGTEGWERKSFWVSDYVEPTSTVSLRWQITDIDSLTEAALDNFSVTILDCGTEFIRGDANVDGNIDISDAVATLDDVFLDGWDTPCDDGSDTDDDGDIDLLDVFAILGYLFEYEADPAAPFPDCGSDPTPDDLDCTAYDPCL